MKRSSMVSVYPDGCECSARDRGTCAQACKPTRHKIRCAIVSGRGKCDCGAVKPETCLSPARIKRYGEARRTKYPLGKPLVVHMTEARIAANKRAEDERTFAEKWHAVSGQIYIHPCDFAIGMSVHWHRAGRVLHGTVVSVNEDMLKPAKVRRHGPLKFQYTPSVYDFCDASGDKPCVCDLPTGQRTECQHRPNCPIPGIKAALDDKPVKLMQGHSPAALAGVVCIPHNTGKSLVGNRQLEIYASGANHNAKVVPDMEIVGSMMGPDEYAKNITPDPKLGDYVVKNGGIYLRNYNVRLATFAPNSAALRETLADVFADAHHIAALAEANVKRGKVPVSKQIAAHQREERAANNGWYTHGCGQWVHDKLCPCSVCGPKRKPRKKK